MPVNLTIQSATPGPTIEPGIYGHFAEHLGRCIEEGFWVGEDSLIPNRRGIRNDVVDALRHIQTPVLRWPGGCFADEYHWMDGVGPRDRRVPMVNTHWGGVPETNEFGTHEFMDLCEQIGASPYVNGNVGSGTVREMQEWVEYITHGGQSPPADRRRQNEREEPWKLRFFGVGNENWGCGGNMRPEYYADLYRRYATYVRNFSGNHIYKIACGPNADDYHWTEVLMREAGGHMHGLSLHYYTIPTGNWERKGNALGFDEAEWHSTLQQCLKMETLVRKHSAIMDEFDPTKRVALIVDEWGVWYDLEPENKPGYLYQQQNSLRDALVAGLTLNVFNNHADRVRMGNLAQTVNVLQSLILTDGPRMVCTPTYHVFDLYKGHQGATLLETALEGGRDYVCGGEKIPQVSASASRKDGQTLLTLCNTNPHQEAAVHCHFAGDEGVGKRNVEGRILTAAQMDAHNTFDNPQQLIPAAFDGARWNGDQLEVVLPPMAVAAVRVG